VEAVKNPNGRPVSILHDQRQLDTLGAGKTNRQFFKGAPVTGYWELRALKTPAEKAGRLPVPHFITLTVTLKHKT